MSTFTQTFQALTEVQASKSPNTLAQWKSVQKRLVWFETNCNDLSDFVKNYEGYWSRFKAYQAANPKADGQTRKLEHCRRYLVQALKRAERREWITKAFKKSDFDLFEAKSMVGKSYTDDEVKALLAALELNPKTKLQVLMAVTMGMRKSEILKLSKPEVLWDTKAIRLNPNRLKTRQARKVDIPITLEVEPLLKRYYDEAKGIYVFPKIDTRAKGPRNPIVIWDQPQSSNTHAWTLARKLSGATGRYHDLRHTCASNHVSNGTPTIHITQVMGMSETMLKNIYAHVQAKDSERIRTAFNGRFETTKEITWKNVLTVGRTTLEAEVKKYAERIGLGNVKRRIVEVISA